MRPVLTQLEFTPADHKAAATLAHRLGYRQTAYTSGSALIGLFCLADFPTQRTGCVIKTAELGLMFVSDLRDLNALDLAE